MKKISIDIETYSDVDLAKSGVYRYSESPKFEVLLFGYSVDGGPVTVVDLASGERIPEGILDALTDNSVTKWAFNASFERVCLSAYLRRNYPEKFRSYGSADDSLRNYLDPAGWRCSMIWAAYLGLPLSLEKVGAVLMLTTQKMKEGKELIRYFCKPDWRAKFNDGKERNYPKDGPQKWEVFKSYNKRDVETEMAIQERLSKFPVPESVWEEYHIDQAINDRGILLDNRLVKEAIDIDAKCQEGLLKALRHITKLENPNSVSQLKGWLEDNGVATESLGKKTVSELIKKTDGEIKEVLMLRTQSAKSSIKKYIAMMDTACADRRARGMFQFYGANRSGRWAGRHIQLQNLPQNHMPDLEEARGLVRDGNYEMLQLLYDSIPDVLSQLIRTAFIAKPGYKFIVSDFSAIEARVLSYLAGEKWRSDVFKNNGDIYCMCASNMFHVPVVKHGINGDLRQKGKIAELACIAEGELVLTDQGLIPIERVTPSMKVWDGESWVAHEGVVFRGIKEVMTYEGLTATPDHLVYVQGEKEPVQFGIAAARGAHLVQAGNGRRAVRVGKNYQPRETLEPPVESLLRPYPVPGMWKHSVEQSECSAKRKNKRLPALFAAVSCTALANKETDGCKDEMRESRRPGVSELWSQRNPVQLPQRKRSRNLYPAYPGAPETSIGTGPNQHERELRAGEYSIRNQKGELCKSPDYRSLGVSSGVLAILPSDGHSEALSGSQQGRNYKGSGESRGGQKEKLAYHIRKVRVYDIRNAGPNHRFTVSGCLVHNCGYGGSIGALRAMGALDMGVKEEELKPLVDSWRNANPHIVNFWWEVDRAVKKALEERVPVRLSCLTFFCQSGMLFIGLPSGRRLAYVQPKMGTNRFGNPAVTYMGIGATKKWESIESYGPKFVENITQAISRDILCYAMKSLSHQFICGHVHDELIIECPKDVKVESICQIMGKTPPWLPGLVLRADGYETPFYKKD